MSDDAFRFSNSILSTKVYQDDAETDYNPFFNNRILSQHADCILHANAMNLYHNALLPKMQYDYYFHSIDKMKRKFAKWGKHADTADIELVQRYFNCSYRKALEAMQILNITQLEHIRRQYNP